MKCKCLTEVDQKLEEQRFTLPEMNLEAEIEEIKMLKEMRRARTPASMNSQQPFQGSDMTGLQRWRAERPDWIEVPSWHRSIVSLRRSYLLFDRIDGMDLNEAIDWVIRCVDQFSRGLGPEQCEYRTNERPLVISLQMLRWFCGEVLHPCYLPRMEGLFRWFLTAAAQVTNDWYLLEGVAESALKKLDDRRVPKGQLNAYRVLARSKLLARDRNPFLRQRQAYYQLTFCNGRRMAANLAEIYGLAYWPVLREDIRRMEQTGLLPFEPGPPRLRPINLIAANKAIKHEYTKSTH